MATSAEVRDYAWGSLAILMAVATVLNVGACLFLLLRGNVVVLVQAPAGLLFGYWIAVGAWRRTCWGRVTVDADERGLTLSSAQIRRLILLAAACLVALPTALAWQVIQGRS